MSKTSGIWSVILLCSLLVFVKVTVCQDLPPQTRDTGAFVGDNDNSLTAGANGGILLQDIHLVEKLQRFDRERIPERVVHARGTGAHGFFENFVDFSNYTTASFLQRPGDKIEVFTRFSLVIPSKSGAETTRDPRGFAVKMKTAEGNWDLVGNNLPVFFIRDTIKFPDVIHSLKPDPVTNVQDPNRFFDLFSLIPESTHMLSWLYSDLGIPASYRKMFGNSVHAYKFVSKNRDVTYVKFNWESRQGIENLTLEEAQKMQSTNLNHLTNDLYENIRKGNFPSWDLRVQMLKPEELGKFDFDALDATKEWRGVPFRTIGRMTLNRVPDNFFAFTEQVAFCVSNIVPGIEFSEDRMLQGRILSYVDTQIYRLGSSNYHMLPVNRPNVPVRNDHQDGVMMFGNVTRSVNYSPSRLDPQFTAVPRAKFAKHPLMGTYQQAPINKTLNFRQAGEFYRDLSASDQENLIKNLASDLKKVENSVTKNTLCAFFLKADRNYGMAVIRAVDCDTGAVEGIVANLEE